MHSRAYVWRTDSAKTRPKFDKHININGTPIIAYAIVTIFPSTVFGVKLPYPRIAQRAFFEWKTFMNWTHT